MHEIIFSRCINTHTSDYWHPEEAIIMKAAHNVLYKRTLHILMWTSAVCLKGTGCRFRSRGRVL